MHRSTTAVGSPAEKRKPPPSHQPSLLSSQNLAGAVATAGAAHREALVVAGQTQVLRLRHSRIRESSALEGTDAHHDVVGGAVGAVAAGRNYNCAVAVAVAAVGGGIGVGFETAVVVGMAAFEVVAVEVLRSWAVL